MAEEQMSRLEMFRRAITNMIATSDESYNRTYLRENKKPVRKYTKEEIERIINSGSLIQQSNLSNNYFALDGFYRRILIYYATYLKYIGVLIPSYDKITKEVQTAYRKAAHFIDKIDMYSVCSDFAVKALVNGTYYGVIQHESDDGIAILDLPFKYCSSRFKDQQNNDVIEFNLAYFDSIADKKQKKIALQTYPSEIVSAYKKWTKEKTVDNQYYIVPSNIGICFPFFDGRPMFLTTLLDIVEYYEYKAYDKEKVKEDIRKIFVQKVPHLTTTGELVFETDEAEAMHQGTVGMLKNNKNVSVLTTYADTEMYSSDTSNEAVNNILEKASNAIYKQAGVSPQLFSLTGNVAVEASLNKDGAMMMYLATKFGTFFTNLIQRLYGSDKVSFKYEFLPISFYNEKQFVEDTFKLAASGYSFIMPSLALGISQNDLYNIKRLEKDILKLDKVLMPLQSAYTQTATSTEKKSNGGQTKETSEKAERTLQTEKSNEGGGE